MLLFLKLKTKLHAVVLVDDCTYSRERCVAAACSELAKEFKELVCLEKEVELA